MSQQMTIAAFDVETTGKNPVSDQIVEISVVIATGTELWQVLEAADGVAFHRRIRPEVPVSPGAEAVHGISDADLAGEQPFETYADEIRRLLDSADILMGYNVGFDIRFIEAEFQRIGQTLDLASRKIVDPLRIWHTLEPRRLENAFDRFVGGTLAEAHSAEADTRAVMQVLAGMGHDFGLHPVSWDDLAAMTAPNRQFWIGNSHHIRWEADRIVIGFGKYDGRPLMEIATADPDYLRWIRESDFPPHVKSLCKGATSGIGEEAFVARVLEFYGQPGPLEEAE